MAAFTCVPPWGAGSTEGWSARSDQDTIDPFHRTHHHPGTSTRFRGGEPMAMTAPLPKLMGQPVKRREDPRLITGTSQYVDDITLPGMLHLSFVRSPHGHAKVNGIDTAEALKVPGVVA